MNKRRVIIGLSIVVVLIIMMNTACSGGKGAADVPPSASETSTKTLRPTRTYTSTPGPTAVLPVELSTIEIAGLPEITFTLDGKTAYLNYFEHVEVLDTETFKPISDPLLEEYDIIGVYGFSPDGKILIVQTSDTSPRIALFNIETKNIQKLGTWSSGNINVKFSSGSSYAIYSKGFDYNGNACGYFEGISYSEELSGGKFPFSERGCTFEQRISDAAISPDGDLAAGAVSEYDGNTLYIWDVHDQSILHEIKNLPAHILSVDFSSDGSTLVSLSEDGNIIFWDPLTGQKTRNIQSVINKASKILYTENSSILLIKSYKDQYTYNTVSGVLTLLSHNELSEVEKQLIEQGQIQDGYQKTILFSPDNSYFALISGSIQVRDATTAELRYAFYEEEAFNYGTMVFSKDSTKLAVIVDTGNVYVWDLETGKEIFALENAKRNDYTPYGELITADHSPYSANPNRLYIAFSPDGENIAITNASYVEIWNISSQRKVKDLEKISSKMLPTKLSYSEDGQKIYGVLNINQDAAIWDVSTGKLIRQLNLPFEDPENYLDTELYEEFFAREHIEGDYCTIEIRNLETNEIIDSKTFPSPANSYIFTQDKNSIVGFFHSEFNQWKLGTGEITVISMDDANGAWSINSDNSLLAFFDSQIFEMIKEKTLSGYTLTVTDISAFTMNLSDTTKATTTPLPDVYNEEGFYIGNEEFIPTREQTFSTINVEPLSVPSLPVNAITNKNITSLSNQYEIGKGLIIETKWSSDGSRLHVISSSGYYLLDGETLSILDEKRFDNLNIIGGAVLSNSNIKLCGTTPQGTIQVWDAVSNKIVLEINQNAPADISTNGQLLAILAGNPDEYYRYMKLDIWNLVTKQQEQTMSTNPRGKDFLFSADNSYIALITNESEVNLWDVKTGLLKQTIQFENPVNTLNFSGNSKYLLIGVQSKVYLWHIYSQQFLHEIDFSNVQDENSLNHQQDVIHSIAMNNQNTQLAVALEGRTIWLYDMIKGQKTGTIAGIDSIIQSMSFSQDDSHLLTVDENGRLTIWESKFWKKNTSSNEFTGKILGMTALADGTMATWTANRAIVFNPESGVVLNQVIIPESKILAISPKNDYIAGYSPYNISMYDLTNGDYLRTPPFEAEEYYPYHYVYENTYSTQLYGADFDTDGTRLIAYGSGGIWMVNPKNGEIINHPEHGNLTQKAALSNDGELVAFSNVEYWYTPALYEFDSPEVSLWLESPQIQTPDATLYNQYSFSPDKKWIALLRDAYNQPSLLDIHATTNGRLTKQTTLGYEEPTVMAFNPDGSLIAVGFENGEVRIVDFEIDQIIYTLQAHISPITAISFTQDGKHFISADETGQIKVWGLE